jgi:hypothetical protein
VAAHYVDDALAELIADRPSGAAYRVTASPGSDVTETLLETRYLGDPAE